LETIPTPKEFKDAIESLSPEQQRFAKQFRAMQLASTLFAVLVIQVKPQMEKLLKIPPFSLTKEIKLTQQLQDLFLQYQIPSDLLSFDGEETSDKKVKIDRVKENIGKIYAMINAEKQKELDKKKEEEKMRVLKVEEERRERMVDKRSSAQPVQSSMPMQMMMMAPSSRQAMPRPSSSAVSATASAAIPPKPKPTSSASSTSSAPPTTTATSVTVVSKPSIMDAIMPSTPTAAPTPSPTVDASPQPEAKPDDKKPEQHKQKQEKPVQDPDTIDSDDELEEVIPEKEDFTKVPTTLDRKYEELSEDSNLRPTIINTDSSWTKSSQRSLLSTPTTATLGKTQQVTEKNKAFDLLDALSRSGSLSVDSAQLHVIIAATHCFVKDLVDTVIQDNINPIEKVEKSNLIVATTVHDRPALEILKPEHVARVATYSPQLFLDGTATSTSSSSPLAISGAPVSKDVLAGKTAEKVKA